MFPDKMNHVDHIMKSPESDTSMTSLGGSVPTSPGSEEKKSVPIMLQKHVLSPTSAKNTLLDSTTELELAPLSANNFPVPKITAFGSLSQNGKFVQVQSGSSLSSSPVGVSDVARQKVLLTSMTSNDCPRRARLILPRLSSNNVQVSSTSSKQICRSFSMIPCSQGTIVSPITVKSPDGASKIIQPNIIRPRPLEGKIITSGSGMPIPGGIIVPGIPLSGGIIVPGKSSPPTTITFLKSASKPGSSSIDKLSKMMGLDKRETEEKPPLDSTESISRSDSPKPSDDSIQADDKEKDKDDMETKLDDFECTDSVCVKPKEENVEEEKIVIIVENKEDSKNSNLTKITDQPEEKAKDGLLSVKEVSVESVKEPPILLGGVNRKPLPALIPRECLKKEVVSSREILKMEVVIPRECVKKEEVSPRECVKKEVVTPIEGRARKRKGILSSSVSSSSKGRPIAEVYENVRLLPGSEEIDPFSIIDWDDDGTGHLPESTIELVVTDLGLIELNASLNDLENNRHGKIEEADEIYCCVHCGCYGLISEFYNESYCSTGCREQLISQQESIVNLDDIESSLDDDWDKRKVSSVKKISENLNPKKILENLNPKKISENLNPKKTSENLNPKKISENLNPKKTSENLNHRKSSWSDNTCKDLTKMGKVVSLLECEFESFLEDDKKSEEALPTVDFEKDSSSSPPRKISITDPAKIKKILPKPKPLAKPTKPSKPPPTPITPTQENTSKIKLRPRSGIKICNKYSGDIIQDLCMGSTNTDNKVSVSEGKKSSGFRWNLYLSDTKGSPAWVKLFTDPFPSKPNRFKVGQKLEAIDPEHQSYFCLVSVTVVKGYRLKLHFDGYPPEYDFWVNANSPYIFPAEFCSSHKITLHPPPGIPTRSFDWDSYLTRNNARGAPAALFDSTSSESGPKPNLFKTDMKLEAVDRKNTFLVCVSTVAAVMENRILVHFDSWGDMYDYWIETSSPYIRPVGWCEANDHPLTPPNGIKSGSFSWKKYLKDTKSISAPEKAFCLRQPIEFKKGMKIEAVDKRAPHLLRVASISAVLPYQVNITFDGFPSHFGYWVDDDSPDIHPVGWGSRSGHPLEPPPTEEDFLDSTCKTPGCMGQGHLKGTKYEDHDKFEDCPYATEHLTKDTALTDRLKWSNVKFKQKYGEEFCTIPDDSDEESDEDIENIRWTWLKVQQEANKLKTRISEEDEKNILKSTTKKYPPQSSVKKKNEVKQLPISIPEAVKTECDSFPESEEIKKIFGPSSPIPIIDEDIGREIGIENIKSECEDSEMSSTNLNDSNNEVEPVVVKTEIKEEVEEEEMQEMPNTEEMLKTSEIENDVKVDFPDCGKNDEVIIKKEIEVQFDKKVLDIAVEGKESSTSSQIIGNHNKGTPKSNPFTQVEKMEVILPRYVKREVRHSPGIIPKLDIEYLKRLEEEFPCEEQALIWTPKQVSQFTKSLVSCSSDCFLKEGINGANFLLMNKNDLLMYLGLSDVDAERVFNKIRRLRLKTKD